MVDSFIFEGNKKNGVEDSTTKRLGLGANTEEGGESPKLSPRMALGGAANVGIIETKQQLVVIVLFVVIVVVHAELGIFPFVVGQHGIHVTVLLAEAIKAREKRAEKAIHTAHLDRSA